MSDKLTIPHLRVLEVLYQSGGLLSRSRIADRVQKQQTYVGRVIGYSDADKRKAFKTTKLGASVGTPLLDRGYVREKELDIDGLKELVVEITKEGERAYLKERGRLKEFITKKATKDSEDDEQNVAITQLEETDLYCFEQVTE